MRRFLHAHGFRFRLHRTGLPGKPDVVLPRYGSVILVHGCFWRVHDCPLGRVKPKTNAAFWEAKRDRTVRRDGEKVAALEELGWRVRVIWECAIEAGSYTNGLCDWVRGIGGSPRGSDCEPEERDRSPLEPQRRTRRDLKG